MKRLIDNIKYHWIDLKLQREVKKRFYIDPEFQKLDQALLTAYIFKNPYTISRKYLQKKQEKMIHTYGETPLSTYDRVAQEVGLKPTDIFLELGSGRGRGALFINHFYNCQTIGIERIPQFVKLSRHLAKTFGLERVTFTCADMVQIPLPQASVIYLYGICLPDAAIEQLITNFQKMKKGTQIVSISFPLTDYDSKHFALKKSFPVTFPWGETEGYVNLVIK